MRRLFKQLFKPKPVLIEIGMPEPITGLERVKSNVKVMWTPSKSNNVIAQYIKVVGTGTGKIFIEKEIDPQDYAFSFAANKGAALTITIRPFNGTKLGAEVSLDIIV